MAPRALGLAATPNWQFRLPASTTGDDPMDSACQRWSIHNRLRKAIAARCRRTSDAGAGPTTDTLTPIRRMALPDRRPRDGSVSMPRVPASTRRYRVGARSPMDYRNPARSPGCGMRRRVGDGRAIAHESTCRAVRHVVIGTVAAPHVQGARLNGDEVPACSKSVRRGDESCGRAGAVDAAAGTMNAPRSTSMPHRHGVKRVGRLASSAIAARCSPVVAKVRAADLKSVDCSHHRRVATSPAWTRDRGPTPFEPTVVPSRRRSTWIREWGHQDIVWRRLPHRLLVARRPVRDPGMVRPTWRRLI